MNIIRHCLSARPAAVAQLSFGAVKRILVIITLALAEIALFVLFSHSEQMLQRRVIMFDPDQSEFYDLISSIAVTGLLALPVVFTLIWKVLPRFTGFVASRLSVRVLVIGVLSAVVYCVLWLLLSFAVSPAFVYKTPNKDAR